MEKENYEILEDQNQENQKEPDYSGKKATIAMRYDYKSMKYFHVYTNLYRRKIYIRYIILVLLTLGGAAFLAIDAVQKSEAISYQLFIIPAIFVLISFYIAYQAFNIENNLDKRLAMIFMRQKPVELNFELREDKIRIIPLAKPDEVFEHDWVHITAIDEIPQYYFFYYGRSPLLIIEKNPELMIDGSYETLLEIIKEKISFKPYHFLDKEIVKKPITFVEPDYPNPPVEEEKTEDVEVIEENDQDKV